MNNYIYLVHEQKFENQNIYKIGKSKQSNVKRVQSYGKGTKLLFQSMCEDCDKKEKEILSFFKNKYEQTEHGRERFKGNYRDMIIDIYHLLYTNNTPQCVYSSIDVKTIDTFSQYQQNSSIDKIIITNKETEEGYLRIKNHAWRKLWGKDTDYFEYITLRQYLKYYRYEHTNMADNIDLVVGYFFDYNKIINDLCVNHYNNNPVIYSLKYNEIIMYNYTTDYILNTNTFTSRAIGIEFNNKIIQGDIHNEFPQEQYGTIENIKGFSKLNHEVVDNILRAYIKNTDTFIKFKQLCYNICVDNTETILFHSYNDCEILESLLYQIDDICSYEYLHEFSSKEELKKCIQNEYIPRCVILNSSYKTPYNVFYYTKRQLQLIINFILKTGVKNIYIKHENIDMDHYDYERYIIYIEDNKKNIVKACSSYAKKTYHRSPYLIVDDNLNNYHTAIFESYDALKLNFLKWCCSKIN